MSETVLRTAQQALSLWDAGETVPAFEVESEGNSQETLWGAAFDVLAGRESVKGIGGVTKRERDVIASIVFVASQLGKEKFPRTWLEMVRSHVHEKSPALTIRKPAATTPPAPPVPSIASGPAGADDPAGLLPDLSEQTQKEAKSQETGTPAPTPTPGPLPGA